MLVLVNLAALAFAQTIVSQTKPANNDPLNNQRKIKREPDDAFKKWIEDVGPIISKEEEDAWKKLRSVAG
jgi:AAA+ ATPase superfamily predicted ATPase